MRTLTQADFLALWETGRTLHPLDQGVLAVQAAFPEVTESIADWPIGRRNRALAELRCAAFGRKLRGWTACRRCGEKLEFELDGQGLANGADVEWMQVEVGGETYRLPTSRDLAAVAGESDGVAAAERLLRVCHVNGGAGKSEWSEEEIDEVGERMALADPLAEIRLSFDCPVCREAFEESLDLPTFLWTELTARAKRLMTEVHLLASAYGWSEAEILRLSLARREFYLGMVGA
jgi:hypothetical protein